MKKGPNKEKYTVSYIYHHPKYFQQTKSSLKVKQEMIEQLDVCTNVVFRHETERDSALASNMKRIERHDVKPYARSHFCMVEISIRSNALFQFCRIKDYHVHEFKTPTIIDDCRS
jgi:hypothetical protein